MATHDATTPEISPPPTTADTSDLVKSVKWEQKNEEDDPASDIDSIPGEALAEGPVTPDLLLAWLRRARRKFVGGLPVIKVCRSGKLVRRTLTIGAKPEYMELISAKLFDTAYHLTDVLKVTHGVDSPDFNAFKALQPGRQPKPARSLTITVPARTISLVFMTETERRDAEWVLRHDSKYLRHRIQERARLSPPVPALGGESIEAAFKSNDPTTPYSSVPYTTPKPLVSETCST